MAENSAIEWTDHTFNPWWGCQKVSPACDHCYAERDAKRFAPGRVLWGVGSERRTFEDKHWQAPLRWNEAARKAGKRARVFCASMADVFDKDAPSSERARLFELIEKTPNLDWLLLTKRIGNVQTMLGDVLGDIMRSPRGWPWPNVWLGITVVTQEEADRDIPKLLAVPARVRFLSIEPMLGPISFEGMFASQRINDGTNALEALDWVIAGGESGPHARPAHPDWFRSLRDQCAAAGVPFLFKQWGEWGPDWEGAETCSYCGKTKFDAINSSGECGHCGVDDWLPAPKPLDTPRRIGKKLAGRLLDGVEHNGFPEAVQA